MNCIVYVLDCQSQKVSSDLACSCNSWNRLSRIKVQTSLTWRLDNTELIELQQGFFSDILVN